MAFSLSQVEQAGPENPQSPRFRLNLKYARLRSQAGYVLCGGHGLRFTRG